MILIVEDDPLSRRALEFLFASKGYASRAVGSAEEALDVLHTADRSSSPQGLPEMLLVDIDLPGMSGLQLVKNVQTTYPTVPCTLMSANHQELLRQEPAPARSDWRSNRQVPFLPKPLDFGKLMNVVRQHA